MAKVRNFKNTKCLKCGRLQEDMYMVGPMVFCPDCFIFEFYAYYDKTVPSDSDVYKKWLHKYAELLYLS
jgi:hypothetical protein